ncbi:MAG: hypothetical protein KC501_19550 [Myxococcales bacterium]|nr:hypothetical protein [Myxococcales bacterium]
MAVRPKHVYFDDDGAVHPLSHTRLTRALDGNLREPIAELSGRRARLLTLYVLFEDRVPIEVVCVEPAILTFDPDGCRNQADAAREMKAAVAQLGPARRPDSSSNLIPAAARFEAAAFTWTPTKAQIEAAIAAHRLRSC